ncbi:UV excision repair protein rhp23 [Talaromyces islandicus]|uniref:UV excision repair protein RAD23 n=1 Tax=Talaromyces islandicus TaxID=28573 RepID=A0A0U1M0Q0_TALIS|nr:UV excision repair protein rhp23 [Talaromyces islandicus]
MGEVSEGRASKTGSEPLHRHRHLHLTTAPAVSPRLTLDNNSTSSFSVSSGLPGVNTRLTHQPPSERSRFTIRSGVKMKLTFRDLKQQKFTIEAEPTETVGQVKEKIAQEKGWEASQQKLIYSGKILQDANTIESYNIEEKGFIPKPSPAAAAGEGPSTPAKAAPAQTPAAPAPSAAPAAPQVPTTPSPAAPATSAAEPPSFNDPSALAMGPQGEAAVAQMEAMGFPRADIDRAMRAAFFNPDRAIEYLLNGIPENVQQEQQQAAAAAAAPPQAGGTPAPPPPAAPADTGSDEPMDLFQAAAQVGQGGAQARGGRSAAAGGGDAGALGNLDFLRNNPHFQQLRQLVQQQPQMLEPILQQIGAGNPQLAQLIGQNQEQFLQLLSEDIGEEGELPPGAHEIRVTEEERDAIERLCRLGFSRDSVIQAYFACDKNEELAANFLFEQPDENDEQ